MFMSLTNGIDHSHNMVRALSVTVFGLVLASCTDQLSLAEIDQLSCTGSTCNGQDPIAQGCNNDITNGQSNVTRWGLIGTHYVAATIHKSARCGGAKWAFATTSESTCGVFSTW